MTKKSGIEMIEELIKKVEVLDKRYVVIEQLLKQLVNKTNGFNEQKQPVTKTEAVAPITNVKPQASVVKSATRVLGRIRNKEGRAVSGVRVRVFNEQNQVVKETATNKAGEWMSFLPPGRYGAEYYMKDMVNANVNFKVEKGQKQLRIAQPIV